MYNADDVYMAARALRPQLKRILDEPHASALEMEIDNLLQRSELGDKVDELLLNELTQDKRIRAWLKTALVLENVRGVDALPGDVGTVAALRFVCPEENGHFEWFLRRKGRPVPPCPVHNIPLIRAD